MRNRSLKIKEIHIFALLCKFNVKESTCVDLFKGFGIFKSADISSKSFFSAEVKRGYQIEIFKSFEFDIPYRSKFFVPG